MLSSMVELFFAYGTSKLQGIGVVSGTATRHEPLEQWFDPCLGHVLHVLKVESQTSATL